MIIKYQAILSTCTLYTSFIREQRMKRKRILGENSTHLQLQSMLFFWREQKEELTTRRNIHRLQNRSTALRDNITSMQAMHEHIHILTHRMHRLIGISSAAVRHVNIHVYSHI